METKRKALHISRRVKISVVTACFNCAPFLGEAIESVLQQTYTDWELIVVDDASVDGSGDIAHRYSAVDDRISVIDLPRNMGPAVARNAAIEAATGDWIAILDADDIAMPSRLSEQIDRASGDADLVMVGSGDVVVDAGGRTQYTQSYPQSHRSLLKRLLKPGRFPRHSSMLFRWEALEHIGLYNQRLPQAQDWDLFLRLSGEGQMTSIRQPLVKYRVHQSNITHIGGGKPQFEYGRTATVCWHLRDMGYPDPATAFIPADWETFLKWTRTRLDEEDAFALAEAKADVGSVAWSSGDGGPAPVRATVALFRSGAVSAITRQKLFGDRLPRQLAEEWIALRG